MQKIEIIYVEVDAIYGIRRTREGVLRDQVDYYDFDDVTWQPEFHPDLHTSIGDPEEVLIVFETLQACATPEVLTADELRLEIANRKLAGDDSDTQEISRNTEKVTDQNSWTDLEKFWERKFHGQSTKKPSPHKEIDPDICKQIFFKQAAPE